MKSTEELHQIFSTLICPKKNKLIQYQRYINDWLVQVILDGDLYVNVYYTNPPIGIPEFVAETIDIAWNVAMNEAYTRIMARHEEIRCDIQS